MKPANVAGPPSEFLSTRTATGNPVTDRIDNRDLHPRLLFHDRLVSALERATHDDRRLALACLDAADWHAIEGGTVPQQGAPSASWQQGGRCFLLIEDLDTAAGDIAEAVRQSLGRADVAVGIAVFPDHAGHPDALCDVAAAALVHAAPGSYGLAERRGTLAAQPDAAEVTGHGHLALHYQPQLWLANGRVFGAEALARVSNAPQAGHEASGQNPAVSGSMDESFVFWTLEHAVGDLAAWRGRALPDVRVAINLSLELAESAELPRRIDHLLRASAVPPGCLEIELTEHRPSLNLDAVARVLEELRVLGVRLALDDFGTGFASLSLLERLPFDTLKVDLSFVAGLDAEPGREEAEHIVRDIIGLAHCRDLTVIAEGVERTAQLAALRRLGCDACQGYLFSPPVPGDAFAGILTAGLASPL